MINPFKEFTKKKIGGLILIFVIIIAFGFGGFGGGFSTGNQNNIAKINNTNITAQDFMEYLNESGLSKEVIKENIDKNIVEELLSALVSTTLLNLEIEELDLSITKDVLIELIGETICNTLLTMYDGYYNSIYIRKVLGDKSLIRYLGPLSIPIINLL